MGLEKFFKKKENKPPIRILPESVRYALRYKESLLGLEEITALAENGFIHEAIYLTFKSFINDPVGHKAFLEKYIFSIFNTTGNQQDIFKRLISEALGDRNNISVKGGKLAQISRQGFDLWQDRFQSFATRLSNDERHVFLVAHSILVGLDSFLRAFSEKRKALNILVPEWIEKQECGYVISFNEDQVIVNWLHKPFDDKTGSVLLDDTKNTGNTSRLLQQFLIDNNSQEVELVSMSQHL